MVSLVRQPLFYLQEDFLSRPFETPLPVPAEISGVRRVLHTIEKRLLHCTLFTSEQIQLIDAG